MRTLRTHEQNVLRENKPLLQARENVVGRRETQAPVADALEVEPPPVDMLEDRAPVARMI